MIMRQQQSLFIAVLFLMTGSIFHVPAAEASIQEEKSKPPPQIKLRVGKGGGTINVIEFDIPAAQLGNGVPIVGKNNVDIQVEIRAVPAFSRIATLTVDSSNPLTNGSATIVMSTISWVAKDGDIPGGTFNNTTNQVLMSHPNSFTIKDTHDFYYANMQILEAGTYSGRVTYTLTMP